MARIQFGWRDTSIPLQMRIQSKKSHSEATQQLMKNFFDPEKSLFELRSVQWCVGIFLTISLLASFSIAYHARDLPFEFSGLGFAKFADLYKVPAAFIAIGLSLVGLCGANHRSEQAKHQMHLTRSQNIFSNHFKHIEEFEKFLSSMHKKSLETIQRNNKKLHKVIQSDQDEPYLYINEHQYRKLYVFIFPNSRIGKLEISQTALNRIDQIIKDSILALEHITSARPEQRTEVIQSFSAIIDKLCADFEISEYDYFLPHQDNSDLVKSLSAFCLGTLLHRLQNRVWLLTQVLMFDVGYQPSDLTVWLCKIDFGDVRIFDFEDIEKGPAPTREQLFPGTSWYFDHHRN